MQYNGQFVNKETIKKALDMYFKTGENIKHELIKDYPNKKMQCIQSFLNEIKYELNKRYWNYSDEDLQEDLEKEDFSEMYVGGSMYGVIQKEDIIDEISNVFDKFSEHIKIIGVYVGWSRVTCFDIKFEYF